MHIHHNPSPDLGYNNPIHAEPLKGNASSGGKAPVYCVCAAQLHESHKDDVDNIHHPFNRKLSFSLLS